jgi:hypothetical protein
MMSYTVMEWAVTFLVLTPQFKRSEEMILAFGIPQLSLHRSYVPSPSKMVAIMAADVLFVEFLGLVGRARLQYYPCVHETFGTNVEL